jgi:hypothetical protein
VRTFAAVCLVGAGLLSAVAAAPQDGSPAPVRRVTTDHLQIATYATQAAVSPGSAFNIVFDIKPRGRMHVGEPSGHRAPVPARQYERGGSRRCDPKAALASASVAA